MRLNLLAGHSIKTRVTLSTTAIFLASLWCLSLFAAHELELDTRDVMGTQQLSVAALLADQFDQNLRERLQRVELAATTLGPALLADPAALQDVLDNRLILRNQFDGGVLVVDGTGKVSAELPRGTGRVGSSELDLHSVTVALQQNRSNVGQPFQSRLFRSPMIGISAPLRDEHGRVIGALTGLTRLLEGDPSATGDARNFLSALTHTRYGHGGGYLLIDPQQRQVITSSRQERIMAPLPAPGVNRELDQLITGNHAPAVMTLPWGDRVIAAGRPVALTGWVVAVMLPVDEAFAPLRVTQRRMLAATLGLTLLAGALTWWRLRGQLAPIFDTIDALAERGRDPRALQPLPAPDGGEIGALVRAFNFLLAQLAQRDQALTKQQTMLTRTEAIAHVGSWEWRLADDTLTWSDEMFHLFRLDRRDRAPAFADQQALFEEADFQRLRQALAEARQYGTPFELELHTLGADDSRRICLVRGQALFGHDQRVSHLAGSVQDITERKHAEQAMAQNEARLQALFDTALDAVVSIDESGCVTHWNRSAQAMFGWRADEMIGVHLHDRIAPERHRAAHREGLARFLATGETQVLNRRIELTALRRSGEEFPVELAILPFRTEGRYHFTGFIADISQRKRMEEQIRQLAYFDSLTGLPNRRMLADRLRQAQMSNRRTGHFGAILFLDLDNFKPLNDTHGHAIGDLLLVEVARRLRQCVREMDTVARLGGDEFVVMLPELATDATQSIELTKRIAEKIRISLAEPYRLHIERNGQPGHEVVHQCSASIGVSLFGHDETNHDKVLKQADAAMYRAKDAGRNRISFHQPQDEADEAAAQPR